MTSCMRLLRTFRRRAVKQALVLAVVLSLIVDIAQLLRCQSGLAAEALLAPQAPEKSLHRQ